jgi:hypothetical protein
MDKDPRDTSRRLEEPPRSGSEHRTFWDLELWKQIVAGIVASLISGLVLAGIVAIVGHVISNASKRPPTSNPVTSSEHPATGIPITATGSGGSGGIISPFNSAVLKRALVSAQRIGSGLKIQSTGFDTSQIFGICGAAPPVGVRATAYETVQDLQGDSILSERIIDWANAADATQFLINDEKALRPNGCNNGSIESYGSYYPATTPQGCGGGQTLETSVSTSSPPTGGSFSETQCGTYTISIKLWTDPVLNDANGDLNIAAGQLAQKVQ